MRKAKILTTGMYVPDCVVTNDILAQAMDTSDEWITQRTGIKERRMIPDTYKMLQQLARAPDKEAYLRTLYDTGMDGKIDAEMSTADLALAATQVALQQANMIGRLDPKTGEVKLVTAPTPKSRPYGLLINSKGVPVYCAFGTNKLATVDPKTMAITEYALPNAESRPRRIALTEDDAIWYADYSRGYLGRFDPKTGEAKEWPSPSGPKSHPYAIAVVDGMVWYNESGMRPDPLVRFDPKTETFQSWAIPSGNIYAGIIRHMRGARDGSLLIHQSSTNRIIQVTVTRRAASR